MTKQFSIFLSIVLIGAAAISIAASPRAQTPKSNSPSRNAYLGFDRDIYPGDAAMPVLKKTFAFTSYWLSPPPAENNTTWLGKRNSLRDLGFGFLVLYRGRDSREFKRAPDGPAKGNLDAQAGITAARKENFPPGTIIFLDVEEGGRLSPTYHAYLHAWADTLARGGYRAGVYCSGMPAQETGGITIVTADDIRAQAGSREFVFFVYNDACPPSPGCSFPGATPAASASGVSYAQAWQFAQSPRRKEFAANCPPGYHANGNCYGPGDTASAWDLDVDTASSADPSSGARP
jgi:hypothetical protein